MVCVYPPLALENIGSEIHPGREGKGCPILPPTPARHAVSPAAVCSSNTVDEVDFIISPVVKRRQISVPAFEFPCTRSWLSLHLHPASYTPLLHRGVGSRYQVDSKKSTPTHVEPGNVSSGQLVKDVNLLNL